MSVPACVMVACHRGSCAVRIQCHRRNIGICKAVFILQAAVFVIYAQLERRSPRAAPPAQICRNRKMTPVVILLSLVPEISRAGGRLHDNPYRRRYTKVASARFGDRGVVVGCGARRTSPLQSRSEPSAPCRSQRIANCRQPRRNYPQALCCRSAPPDSRRQSRSRLPLCGSSCRCFPALNYLYFPK